MPPQRCSRRTGLPQVAEYLKQMCTGAVDTMARAAVFDTLNGRTNFANMDAMNPDDPDTVSAPWTLFSNCDSLWHAPHDDPCARCGVLVVVHVIIVY